MIISSARVSVWRILQRPLMKLIHDGVERLILVTYSCCRSWHHNLLKMKNARCNSNACLAFRLHYVWFTWNFIFYAQNDQFSRTYGRILFFACTGSASNNYIRCTAASILYSYLVQTFQFTKYKNSTRTHNTHTMQRYNNLLAHITTPIQHRYTYNHTSALERHIPTRDIDVNRPSIYTYYMVYYYNV